MRARGSTHSTNCENLVPVSEAERNLVYQAFVNHLSEPVAEVVMELLFTQPTNDPATQGDLHANTTLLRGEISELRGEFAELKGEFAELKGDFVELRAEVRGDIAVLRGEMKADIGNLYRWGAGVMAANGIAVITALLS